MSAITHDLPLLLWLRLRLLSRWGMRNYTRRGREGAPFRLLITGAVALWLLVGVVVPLTAAMSAVPPTPAERASLETQLSSLATLATVVIFFYAVITLAGLLTYASDLKLLLLAPISPTVILGEKFLSTALGFSPILLLTLPGLIARGNAMHLATAYDLMALLMVFLVPLSPVALALLFVLAILRWLPPARARTITAVLGTILGGVAFVGSQLLFNPSLAPRTSIGGSDVPAFLPSTWPGRALAATGLGDTQAAALYLLGTVLLALTLSAVAITLAAQLLATGSATYFEVGRRRPVPQGAEERDLQRPAPMPVATTAAAPNRSTMTLPWAALFDKEWLTLRRDPQRLAQLAYPLFIVGFYLYRLSATSLSFYSGSSDGLGALSLYGIPALTAVLILSSFAASIVNREGRSLYHLALAPLTARSILFAKWAISLVPALAISEILLAVAGVVLHAGVLQVLVTAIVVAALVVALTGFVIDVNLVWPKLEAGNSRRQVSTIASYVGCLGSAIITGVVGLLFTLALSLWQQLPWASALVGLGVFVLLLVISVAAAMTGPRLLANLLSGDEAMR